MKKRKYILVLLALIVPFSVASATIFSDLETSEADITAGTVDSKIGWTEILNDQSIDSSEPVDNPPAIFDLQGLNPGDQGSALITVDTEANTHWLKLKMNQTGSYGKAYYQLDFAEGDVIEDLSPDNLYGSRKLKAIHDNTFDPDRTVNFGSNCLEDSSIELVNSENYATANFTLLEACGSKEYTFASYNKLSGGGWKPDEAANQSLVDYKTEVFEPGEHSIKIQLPETPHSSNGVQLEENLNFLIWQDDGDGKYEASENVIADGTASEIDEALQQRVLLDSESGNDFDAFQPGEAFLGVKWSIDNTCDIAGETKTFDIGFFSSQERNNPEKIDGLFHDSEESSLNTFSVAEDISCENGVCQEFDILSHDSGDEVSLEKETDNGQEDVLYQTEIRNGSIKFDQTGGDPLGEDGQEESQVFELEAEDAGNISFRLKAGPDTPEKYDLEEGEPVDVLDGAFTVELVEKEDENGEQQFLVEAVSDDEGGSNSPALSFIEFNFCGEFPEFRGGDKNNNEPGKSPDKGNSPDKNKDKKDKGKKGAGKR